VSGARIAFPQLMHPLRRPAILVLAAALLLVSARPVAADDSVTRAATTADAALAVFSGTAAVAIADPRTGTAYEHDAERIFPAASLYKLAVLVEVYRRATAGEVSLDDTTITIADVDLGDGGDETIGGSTLSLREAVERMITVSDNSCARALLRLLDIHRVNATAAQLGLRDTVINTDMPAGERTADFNTTSARDMERLFVGLQNGTVISRAASAEMLAVLGRQQINDRLPTGLPVGTHIAHKTGNLEGVAHDVGIIATLSGPLVVIVLTEDYAEYADVVALTHAVANAAFNYPLARFAATFAPVRISAIAPTRRFSVTVRVTNTSTFAWDATYLLGAHWRDATGTYLRWDDGRASLPALGPGESADVTLVADAPATSDPVGILELDVVHEGVAWAGTPVRLAVTFADRR
jgi:beta-lactamase class A